MVRMSRKLKKSMWKEGHRRSPRISALDAWKAQRKASSQVGTGTTCTSATANNNNNNNNNNNSSNNTVNHSVKGHQGPASRTRSRKKRKLRPLEDVAATSAPQLGDKKRSRADNSVDDQQIVHGDNSPKNDDQVMLAPDQSSSAPSTLQMPEKRILGLIVDILQRRDTYEIFAEPVDPEEVEDYYEIIKEPMDFGTMRAKLHEGMYKSLEQFEHDVFLISKNAMHFNSSDTIYFRQGRAIHELAVKVFHALKTDPKNFELEFSETKRRSSRRHLAEAKGPSNTLGPKVAANSRSNGVTSNVSTNTMPSQINGSSNLKKIIQRNHGSSGASRHSNMRDHEVPSGPVDGRRTIFLEIDRRCTCRPWTSLLNKNCSIMSPIPDNPKSLMRVNQQDISYRESLLSFVKDLGQTAKMVAERKLNGWSASAPSHGQTGSNYCFQSPECKNPTASTSSQQEITALDSANMTPMFQDSLNHLHEHLPVLGKMGERINLFDADRGGRTHNGVNCSTLVEVSSNNDKRKITGSLSRETRYGDTTNSEKGEQNGGTAVQLGSLSSQASNRDLNFPLDGFKETVNEPMIVISNKSNLNNQEQMSLPVFEYSQSNVLDSRQKNNHSSSSSFWPQRTKGLSFYQTNGFEQNLSLQCLKSNMIAAEGQSFAVCRSSEAGKASETSQRLAITSQFIFDLPYLKSRLDRINSLGQDRLSQQCSQKENPFPDKMSYQQRLTCTHQAELSTQPFGDDRQQSSLEIQLTDLALQL